MDSNFIIYRLLHKLSAFGGTNFLLDINVYHIENGKELVSRSISMS
jgi:hypothetical protein